MVGGTTGIAITGLEQGTVLISCIFLNNLMYFFFFCFYYLIYKKIFVTIVSRKLKEIKIKLFYNIIFVIYRKQHIYNTFEFFFILDFDRNQE